MLRNLFAFACVLGASGLASAAQTPEVHGQFRWASTAIHFDVSPPLRDIPVKEPPDRNPGWFGRLMVEPDPDKGWRWGPKDDHDATVQSWSGPPLAIPAPAQSFNVGTGTANPPDPIGDVGPNHYLRMSNASFQVFTKTGTSVFGPAAINTLFTGFGGACELENAGDPVVVYDQFADRWLLSQFSDNVGPGFFNCVALSQTSDPTGPWFRWSFPTSVFPDYPKYGVWSNAYVITTRETDANPSAIGVYAIDRTQMLAGNPTPTVISFLNPLNPGVAQFVGDGLLPADIDGNALPPPGSPIYLVGSMDDGGPYGATQDALSLWRMNANFANPPSSTITLASVIPIAPYDTIYPCVGRSCIPQPNGLAVDILSYRQRPTNRAAYRNFGSYESIVTTQSVEAAPNMAGMRWWEIRNPGGTPVLYQDATYAPGVTDGVQRWMGSIAQDRNGNLALGYSASSNTVLPGVRYTGRLERDPLGTMPQGEGEFVAGGGSFTAGTRRWGDYTSMNVDPTDDCTFWYINEYFAANGTTWTLRAGSFKFPQCGQPDFGIGVVPLRQAVCAPAPATFNLDAHGYSGFVGSATLGVSGNPAGTTATYLPASIATVPGSSVLTVGNTGAAAAGSYTLTFTGDSGAPGGLRSRTAQLDLFTGVPGAAGPAAPANGAVGASRAPLLTWTASAQGVTYVAEVATDAAFTNIVFTSNSSTALSAQVPAGLLAFDTQYFWRVRSTNTCGTGGNSAVFNFRTRAAPGVCTLPQQNLVEVFFDNMENGTNGWTTPAGTGPLWAQSTARPFSGARAWLAQDVTTTSNQLLVSPAISLPNTLNSLTLRFQHDVAMESDPPSNCFDGGYVEISTNGGTSFAPLPAGDVLQDQYTGPIATGQPAWCGDFRYRTASLDLSPYAGQTIQLRFRAETDSSVGSLPHGWYVDDVKVEGCGTSDLMFRNGFE